MSWHINLFQASVIYYFRDAQYRHVINSAEEYLKMNHNDPVLQLFKALGILMEGKPSQNDSTYLNSLLHSKPFDYSRFNSQTVDA